MDFKKVLEISCMDIENICKSSFVDLKMCNNYTALSEEEHMLEFREDDKSPYYFVCGKVPVQVSFQENGKDLSALLTDYFIHLKKGDVPDTE